MTLAHRKATEPITIKFRFRNPHGKPIVFGFASAATHFLGLLSFLIIALVTAGESESEPKCDVPARKDHVRLGSTLRSFPESVDFLFQRSDVFADAGDELAYEAEAEQRDAGDHQ